MWIRTPRELQKDKILIQKIKIQVPAERKEWEEFTDHWLSSRKDNKDYLLGTWGIAKKAKEVDVRAIYSIFKSLESIFFMDKRKAVFSSDNIYSHIANLFNDMAEYDYPRMKKHIYDWKQLCDGLIYSVWVKRIKSWNKEKNLPILESLDSCACIFDSRELLDGTNRRYFGVKKEVSVKSLQKGQSEWKYFDLWVHLTSKDYARKKVDVVYFYTIIDEIPYLTTWLGNNKLIGIAEFPKELAGSFGVSVFRPFPLPTNEGMVSSWGTDLIELGASYQNLLKQQLNLLLKQASIDAYGEDRLVNMDVWIDIDELARPSIMPKNIPVEDLNGVNLDDVISVVPRWPAQTKAENSMVMLRDVMQESTWVTEQVQGLVPDKNMTKWENQNIQQNANMRFSTISGFLLLSEESFWRDYVSFNRIHFTGAKNVTLKRKHKNYYSIITRKDITSKQFLDFTVTVESRIEKQRKDQKKFQTHLQLIPFSQQYFWRYGSIVAQRELWELAGEDRETVLSRFPETSDERIARMQLVKLDRNKKVDAPKPGEDHEVFKQIFSSGIPTPENMKNIAIREMLLAIAPRVQEVDNSNAQNLQNITQAQLGNIQSRENANQISSNQDVNAI